jgi:TRAP-type C4-dicarboxylate transport system permease small subunit
MMQSAKTGLRPARFVNRVGDALALASGLAILGLMLFATLDVVMRGALGSGIPGSIEITQVALVAIVFAGMMSAELHKAHVRTPILTEHLPARSAILVRSLGSLVGAAVVGWTSYHSWIVALASTASGEFQFGLAEVPIWPAKLILSVGLTGLFVACVQNVYASSQELLGARPNGRRSTKKKTRTPLLP